MGFEIIFVPMAFTLVDGYRQWVMVGVFGTSMLQKGESIMAITLFL